MTKYRARYDELLECVQSRLYGMDNCEYIIMKEMYDTCPEYTVLNILTNLELITNNKEDMKVNALMYDFIQKVREAYGLDDKAKKSQEEDC